MTYLFSRAALLAVEGSHAPDSVKEALRRAGYKAVVCAARELGPAMTKGFAFLLLDGGVELLRKLRREGDPIPVILLSGEGPSGPLPMAGGAVERLSTPFTLDTLCRAIARLSQNDPLELARDPARAGSGPVRSL